MTSRRSWPSTGRQTRHQLAFVLLLVLVAVGIYVPVLALPSLSLPPEIPGDEKVSMIHTSGISTNCFLISFLWNRNQCGSGER